MPVSVKDLHSCALSGTNYLFRTPTAYDLPKIRRGLTLRGYRRPSTTEFRVAGLAGIVALGDMAGEPDEAARQQAIFAEWHELLKPIVEDDIDEPDFELRAAELVRRHEEQRDSRLKLLADVTAIEANLARHHPPYRELIADRTYYDEISEIEVVRALLVGAGAPEGPHGDLPRDADNMLTDEAYQLLPRAHRASLAAFANGLLFPAETTRKN